MKAQNVVPFQPSENLAKLTMLTEHLAPRLSDCNEKGLEAGNVIEHKMDKGIGVAFGLLYEPNIAVARTTLSAGSRFPAHSHDEREMVLVYEGCLTINLDGVDHILHVGDSIVICPGVTHYATADVDTRVISATVPADKGFPRA
jgi:quercetin dioxygenase-like cupin family protein